MAAPDSASAEPLQRTLLRNVGTSLVVGGILALAWGVPGRWPMLATLLLWPTLGGHFVDVLYLDAVQPKLPPGNGTRVAVRIAFWFVGGVLLYSGLQFTANVLTKFRPQWPTWWVGGAAFVAIELVAHLAPLLRGRPSFYNSRG